MSRRCLTQATVNLLQSDTSTGGLGLKASECGPTPIGGKPPASCGERYVGIRCGGRAVASVPHDGLHEQYSIIATITMRLNGRVPIDRAGAKLMQEISTGFDDLVDSVRACIHADHRSGGIYLAANGLLGLEADGTWSGSGAGPGGPFVTGLQFVGDDDPFPVGDDWFWSAGDEEEADSFIAGIVSHLRFGKCERLQAYSSAQGVA